MTLSGFAFGEVLGSFLGENLAGVSCLGDSGMGSWDRFVLKEATVLVILSEKGSDLSKMGRGVVASLALLSFRRLDTDTESSLGSLLRPILPSFSTATNEVRTLDRGRGDAEGEGVPSDAELLLAMLGLEKIALSGAPDGGPVVAYVFIQRVLSKMLNPSCSGESKTENLEE